MLILILHSMGFPVKTEVSNAHGRTMMDVKRVIINLTEKEKGHVHWNDTCSDCRIGDGMGTFDILPEKKKPSDDQIRG